MPNGQWSAVTLLPLAPGAESGPKQANSGSKWLKTVPTKPPVVPAYEIESTFGDK